MGTNLSQVFISNTDIFDDSTTFNPSGLTSAKVGFWADGAYPDFVDAADGPDAPLFNTQVDVNTAVDAGDPGDVVTIANPLWRYNTLQIVQGTAGNPIATPLLDTRNIRSVSVTSYKATAGHKAVITPDTTFTDPSVSKVTLKVIVRTTPTDQLSFYDQDGTEFSILSGNDPFPLGAFNTTNHKAISVEFDCSSAATFCSKGKNAIDDHRLLSKLVTATDTGTGTSLDLQSKHVGFTFDVIALDSEGENIAVGATATNKVVIGITGQDLGSGNQWQVHGEEVRCRSRYGNFNRMYLPQNMPTYTAANGNYHKIVMEYEHNWPTSTGIAPAGTLNQVVVYVEDTTTTNLTAALPSGSISGTAGTTVKYLF